MSEERLLSLVMALSAPRPRWREMRDGSVFAVLQRLETPLRHLATARPVRLTRHGRDELAFTAALVRLRTD